MDCLIDLLFKTIMGALMPLRRAGAYGTPEHPIRFNRGDAVPWWIECRWPFDTPVIFCNDEIETYFEDGWQIVRPINKRVPFVIWVNSGLHSVTVSGAPTWAICNPRRNRGLVLTGLAFLTGNAADMGQ